VPIDLTWLQGFINFANYNVHNRPEFFAKIACFIETGEVYCSTCLGSGFRMHTKCLIKNYLTIFDMFSIEWMGPKCDFALHYILHHGVPSGKHIGPATSFRFSGPRSNDMRVNAKGKAVPGPRLVTNLPEVTTDSSLYAK